MSYNHIIFGLTTVSLLLFKKIKNSQIIFTFKYLWCPAIHVIEYLHHLVQVDLRFYPYKECVLQVVHSFYLDTDERSTRDRFVKWTLVTLSKYVFPSIVSFIKTCKFKSLPNKTPQYSLALTATDIIPSVSLFLVCLFENRFMRFKHRH